MTRVAFANYACLGCLFLVAYGAYGHSLEQRVSAYQDSQGQARDRLAFNSELDYSHYGAALTASRYTLSAMRDLFSTTDVSKDNELSRQMYNGTRHVTDTLTLGTAQTWNKLTETRQLVSVVKDDAVASRSASLGASQWFWHESLQGSIDISRTLVRRPVTSFADVDFNIVATPALIDSTGVTLGLKHLAGPTTAVNYTASIIATSNRPATETFGAAVKQYVPVLSGAIHVDAYRAINRGRLTTNTDYGQVDAWQGDLAYLQSLWSGGTCRLAYRYYKENETTRAYADQLVYGSDMVSANFAQELSSKDGPGVPVIIELAASRYLSNTAVAANVFEAGVTTKF